MFIGNLKCTPKTRSLQQNIFVYANYRALIVTFRCAHFAIAVYIKHGLFPATMFVIEMLRFGHTTSPLFSRPL